MKNDNLPNIIAIFPLNGALLLPQGNLPLNIFENRYISMVDYAMKTSKMIGVIQENLKSNITNHLYHIGCLGKITQYNETSDGRYLINLKGIIRFSFVKEEKTNKKFRKLHVDYKKFINDYSAKFDDNYNKDFFLKEVKNYLSKKNMQIDWNVLKKVDNNLLITTLASICPFSNEEKQMILECPNTNEIPNVMLKLFKMSNNESKTIN